MRADSLLALRNTLHNDGILFCYSGFITEQILTGIAQAMKSKMAIDATDKKTAKGLFSILIEQAQNVIRYSAEYEPPDDEKAELRYGVLIIGKKDGKHHVTCGNIVRNEDKMRLESSLGEIKDMNKEELKAKYKKVLRGETPEGSKGAGVGFIDIARRALHGFEFDFCDVNDHLSYFSLTAYV